MAFTHFLLEKNSFYPVLTFFSEDCICFLFGRECLQINDSDGVLGGEGT